MIQEILLKLIWPNWLFALTVVVIVLMAYLFYRKTLPPLSAFRRGFAFVLRALSLAIILFLILEPVIRTIFQQNEKPVVAVLADNSASMNIKESYGARGDSLEYVLARLPELSDLDSVDLVPFQFDLAHRMTDGDTLGFDVDGSDITQAITATLDSLSGKNLQAMILLSDGNYNKGTNPFLTVQGSPVPIYSVLVGDSSLPKDIAVRRVQTNQITYVNKKLPVEITFWQNGFDGKQALVSMRRNGRQVAQQVVTLGESGFEQKVSLELVAQTAGDFNYEVAIQQFDEEVTARNNQQNVRIRVLKSKIKVLVISGLPNFDRHSFSFAGSQLEDYEFSFLTEKRRGQYFEAPFREAMIDSQDIFMFYGFPTAISEQAHLDQIMKTVENRQVPVFWIASQKANYQRLNRYERLLPFQLVAQLTPLENQFVQLTNGGRVHPITRLDENESANALLWKELPPLEIYRQIKSREGSQILLEAGNRDEDNRRNPQNQVICYVYRQNEIKHLVFNGTNISNWHFQLQEDPLREQFFVQFMDRAIRWLVNRDDIHQIQIKPLQPVYNVGEAITFSGQVYDDFYQPLSDAQVNISVSGDTARFADEMIAEGNGFYRQSFSGLPEGEYQYRLEAQRNGQTIGQRTGKFTVKPFFLEFQQIPANYNLMKQIADETGGAIYSPQNFLNNFPPGQLESRTQYSSFEYFLWSYWHWLVLLIVLLGTEWFLRKRWGLL